MRKIILSFLLAGLMSTSLVGAARALLQDTETSFGNTVKGATINLKVGDNDPSDFQFTFNNVSPGEIRQFWLPIASVGGMSGNFWLEIGTSNSQEGDNPEPETDVLGEGELAACSEVWVGFDNDDNLEVTTIDWTPLSSVSSLETMAGNQVDNFVETGVARMHLMLRTNNCGDEAMGDSFDLDLTFHLDQV